MKKDSHKIRIAELKMRGAPVTEIERVLREEGFLNNRGKPFKVFSIYQVMRPKGFFKLLAKVPTSAPANSIQVSPNAFKLVESSGGISPEIAEGIRAVIRLGIPAEAKVRAIASLAG